MLKAFSYSTTDLRTSLTVCVCVWFFLPTQRSGSDTIALVPSRGGDQSQVALMVAPEWYIHPAETCSLHVYT